MYNYSSITTKKLDIRHNVAETKPVGTTTFFAEPGKIVKLTAGNTYTSTDTYKSQFCHKILGCYVQYTMFLMRCQLRLTLDALKM